MEQKIRLNCFETNSSSTHSCVITTEEEREKWKKGELLYCYDNFVTLEEAKEDYKNSNSDLDFEDWLYENEYFNYDQWGEQVEDRCEFETTVKEINGIKVYVDCYYGFDG